jgi:hypothetical protein
VQVKGIGLLDDEDQSREEVVSPWERCAPCLQTSCGEDLWVRSQSSEGEREREREEERPG